MQVLQPVHWMLLAWIGLCLLLIAGLACRDWRRARRQDFEDTAAYVLGAEGWCATHPDAVAPAATPAPVPGITLARRSLIEAEARAAARVDYVDNRRRRANPYVRHSREACCWAIAYNEAWTGFEIAAHATADPVR